MKHIANAKKIAMILILEHIAVKPQRSFYEKHN